MIDGYCSRSGRDDKRCPAANHAARCACSECPIEETAEDANEGERR